MKTGNQQTMTTNAAVIEVNAMRRMSTTSNTATRSTVVKGNVSRLPQHCGTCNLRELCLPCGLNGSDPQLLDELVYTRKRVKRGESLYRAGGEFDSLYAIRSGFFKSRVVLVDGRDQVTARA
jgi:CRP-like cAMP-binding protein